MSILICMFDGSFICDKKGNIYISDDSSWFSRLYGIDEELTIIGNAIEKDNCDNYVNLNNILNIKRIYSINKPKKIKEYYSTIKRIKEVLKQEINKNSHMIIRYQGVFPHIACKMARKYHIKQLIELGGDPWDAFWNHGFLGKLIAIPLTVLCKQDLKKSQYVHYVTNNYLQKKYPTKGISSGISNVVLEKNKSELICNRREKLSSKASEKIVIGTAAAVNVRYKGQKYVIKALKLLKKKGYSNFEYEIAGKGDKSFLESLSKRNHVKSQVKFMGALTHEQVFKWMDTLDIYIQPSLQEGLPRSLIEAMSRGLPCIGAKTAGIPELIDSKYVYKKNNMPRRIADLIIKLSKIDEMLEQIDNNYKKSLDYDFDIIKKRREELYNSFLK